MNEHYQIIDLLSSAIVFTYPSWLFADKRRLEELKENILTQIDVLNITANGQTMIYQILEIPTVVNFKNNRLP